MDVTLGSRRPLVSLSKVINIGENQRNHAFEFFACYFWMGVKRIEGLKYQWPN